MNQSQPPIVPPALQLESYLPVFQRLLASPQQHVQHYMRSYSMSRQTPSHWHSVCAHTSQMAIPKIVQGPGLAYTHKPKDEAHKEETAACFVCGYLAMLVQLNTENYSTSKSPSYYGIILHRGPPAQTNTTKAVLARVKRELTSILIFLLTRFVHFCLKDVLKCQENAYISAI